MGEAALPRRHSATRSGIDFDTHSQLDGRLRARSQACATRWRSNPMVMSFESVRQGRRWLRTTTLLLASSGVLALVACGDSDGTVLSSGATTSATSPGADAPPAVLLAERVDSQETRQIYVHILPSLPAESA